jgi:site-specific recombinase XerD
VSATATKTETPLLQGRAYSNFINAIKSPNSREAYNNSLKRYLNHLKTVNPDDLLIHSTNPRVIESQLIDYIMTLRHDGLAYNTTQFLVAPIFTFYQLNDVVLNRKKVSRYLGEFKRVVKDRAYTVEEIHKALQIADLRMKVIILLMASTGCRIGSLTHLTLGNLTKLNDYGIYKIVVYEGTNNEYYTFCSKECASAIDSYLNYRQRCGENISFNQNTNTWEPSTAPLLRQQFDEDDTLKARRPKPMETIAIRRSLAAHLIRCGLREIEHPEAPNSTNRCRKTVALSNGFRKFVITTFINSGLNHEIRELLVDHATHLDMNYFRPSEDQVLEEYLKAEPFLTIDPAMRLREENRFLKVRADRLESVISEIEEVKKAIGL